MGNISTWATSAGGNDTGSPPDFPVQGMPPSTVNDTMRENMAAIARWYNDMAGSLDTGGSGNSYTLTTNNTHAARADQAVTVFRANRTNTASPTLNVDGTGARAIRFSDGSTMGAGAIQNGQMVAVVYDATSDVYKMLSAPRLTGIANTWTGANTFEGAVIVPDSTSSTHAVRVSRGDQRYIRADQSNTVTQTHIASGAVGRAQLKTTTGTVSVSADIANTTAGRSDTSSVILPGGQYGFWPETRITDQAGGSQQGAILGCHGAEATTSFATRGAIKLDKHPTSIAQPASAAGEFRQRYIQSSPPYDHGDGVIEGYVYVLMNADGTIAGLYAAEDPPWYGNAANSPSEQFVGEDGKLYGRFVRSSVSVRDRTEGRMPQAQFERDFGQVVTEDVEITTQTKLRGMDELPHPFSPEAGQTAVLLDPMDPLVGRMINMMQAGESVEEIFRRDYLRVDNTVMSSRRGPPGVAIHAPKWRR